MSYTAPTLAEFTAIFTDFAGVEQAQFDYWLVRAERSIGDEFGDDQLHATQLLLAHLLATQGLGVGIDSQRIAKFGGATRVDSDGLGLGWSGQGLGSEGLKGTRYGMELRTLVLAVKGGPKITGTGTTPVRVRQGFYDGLA